MSFVTSRFKAVYTYSTRPEYETCQLISHQPPPFKTGTAPAPMPGARAWTRRYAARKAQEDTRARKRARVCFARRAGEAKWAVVRGGTRRIHVAGGKPFAEGASGDARGAGCCLCVHVPPWGREWRDGDEYM